MPILVRNIEAEFVEVPDGSVKLISPSGEFGTGVYVGVSGLHAFVQDFSKADRVSTLFTPQSQGFVTEIEYNIEAEAPSSIVEEIQPIQVAHDCQKNAISKVATGSADICFFYAPKFDIVGADKIIEDSITCDFSGITPSDIFTAATTDCYTGGSLTISCFQSQTWSTDVYENGELVGTDPFFTSSATGDTPTNTQVINSIVSNFNSLGYDYSLSGTSFTIQKPYGVTDLRVDVCVDIANDGAICDDCDEYCVTGCTDTFSAITSASTNVYIMTTGNSIDFTFDFTGDTESFTEQNAIFKFEVYKLNHDNRQFDKTPVYQSEEYEYSTFSATSAFTTSILTSDLDIDGDYLIKGYYEHDVCPEFLNQLDLRNDTSLFKNGAEYGLYDNSFDYYFVAINDAEEPIFNTSTDNIQQIGRLVEFSLVPTESGQTEFIINRNINPEAIVTLNGLTLANNEDYELRLSGDTARLIMSGLTVPSDIINIIHVSNSNSVGLTSDVIDIEDPIVSGVTDGQGSNKVYYNTTEGKYEIYTTITPADANDIIVTLNGVTLTNNIDYYQSITNPKRIILEGLLYEGDIINIIYNGYPQFVGDILTQTPTIYWSVANAPDNDNGRFVLEVASDEDFTSIVTSAETSYVVDQSAYFAEITLSGSVGTQYYYRVVNYKEYVTLNGDIITDVEYSEIVPLVVQSNSLNSY